LCPRGVAWRPKKTLGIAMICRKSMEIPYKYGRLWEKIGKSQNIGNPTNGGL